MITFRRAKFEDIGSLIVLAEKFVKDEVPPYGFKFTAESLVRSVLSFIDNHICVVIDDDWVIAGILCGIVNDSIYAPEKFFQEAIFYVDPAYRSYSLSLLKKTEEICLEMGITKIIMAHLSYMDKLERFYEIHGYKILETHYVKELKNEPKRNNPAS